jgi:hypothetical protein
MGIFSDLFGSPKPNSQPPINQSQSDNGSLLPDFSGGKYKITDPRLSESGAVFHMAKELQDTFKSFDTCIIIAETIKDCRGGSGVTKDEIKNGLYRLEEQKKLTKDQVNAALKRLGVY